MQQAGTQEEKRVVIPRCISLRWFLSRLTLFAFRIRITGADRIPAAGSALLASNHVSAADALLIRRCTHRFVRFPTCLQQATDELNRGELVCIFPEGDPTRTGHVQTFQRSVERLMTDAPGVPVLPVYLDGLWRHPLSESGKTSLRHWLRAWRHPIRVIFGEPVYQPVPAHELRQRVLELGTQAVELRKSTRDTLAHRFICSARRNWFHPAIADSTNKRLSFGQTLTAAILLRNWLTTHRQGEKHIGLLLPTSVAAAIANLGVTLAGCTAVNLNFTASDSACRAAMKACDLRTVIASKTFIAKANLPTWREMIYLEDLLRSFTRIAKIQALATARFASARRIAGRISPDDVAAVLFSSGSTGVPKGIELTHWNIVSNVDATGELFSISSSDCMLSVLPIFHSFGYTFGLWFPIIQQFRIAFHPNPTDAKIIGDLAQKHRATFFLSTPTFCGQYTRKCARDQFASLRYILVGAEKLRDSVAREFKEKFGIGLLAGYGVTELGPGAAVNTPDVPNGNQGQLGTRPGSIGRPLPGIAIRIADPDTLAPLPPGMQGMLLVKSPSRMKGYRGLPEKTAEVMRDGFYITGDLGYMDEDGFLFITDRLARFSKIGGEMVPHLKIEEVASEVLTNSACFVTGVPDESRGERLVLLYTSPDIAPTEVFRHLQSANLPPLWIPKRDNIYFVDAIPVLGSGKVDLVRARSLAAEKLLAAVTEP